jgi:glycerophosphoryl diester phosphodiesterase
MGADGVELDVFLLKCGTLVAFHGSGTDANAGLLEGYCINREGSIHQYTNEEIQDNLVFNEHFEEFVCPPSKIRSGKIPTLEEVLMDAKTTNIVVKIELKGAGTARPALELVERLDMQQQCYFSSFNLTQIAVIRQLRPYLHEDGTHVYKTGALFKDAPHDFIELAKQVGASEVHLRYDECTKDRVHAIHAAGMDSMAWFRGPIAMRSDTLSRYLDVGNEDAEMYKVVMQTGVRQMCVNRPNVLVDMF